MLSEERDARDSCRSRINAQLGIHRGHAAQCINGQAHVSDSAAECFDADRVHGFRATRKHRTENGEISTLAFGGLQFFDSMAGNADQKAFRSHNANCGWRNRSGRQMHATGPASQRDIQSGIDQYVAAFDRQRPAHQIVQRESRKFLRTDLDHIHAAANRPLNGLDRIRNAVLSQIASNSSSNNCF